jgi:hypothetical protein
MSALGAFNTQLLRFFEELTETYPEERDIKLALEGLQGVKKVNPKLILDLFYEHVYHDLHEAVANDDEDFVITYAKQKIVGQFNEMSAALIIFDKHWDTMNDANQKAIWKYLKVLCALCSKAKNTKMF